MPNQDHSIGCSVEHVLGMVSGKWKPIILFELFQETKRFSQLQQAIPNITRQVLTTQLRELEKDGLISRKVYPLVPPKVEYTITNLGRKFKGVLDQIEQIGESIVKKKTTLK
ncbi:transcriptional regulator, HxlR family [Seinonella peptonophila]|uniref:Transcriptional regulator, HxlR family n=2 Tax=Seinonella peptonophila TaxID=112248 RepID=A0A1M4WN04_9BACL|nr:helix-turn-helix domain-containing protein [Seinonella peptonophila]SHE82671.1 transcriptional regulator, HxlR family [Seinonella peptonophila]